MKKGRKLISRAKRKFAQDTHCRRCNSERIVRIKYSLRAKIYLLFKECNHTYFCKQCKWTW